MPESAQRPRINSVVTGFHVREMKPAIEFYTTKLGFKVAFRNEEVFTIVSRDGIELSLKLDEAGAKAGQGGCYLKVTGIEAFHEELMVRGIEMVHPLQLESYGMHEFMIVDPDGNTLNFGEPASAKI
jgi:lactoylglutathione lyase